MLESGRYTSQRVSLILTQEKYIRSLNEKINSKLAEIEGISGGSSILPHSSGIVIRNTRISC